MGKSRRKIINRKKKRIINAKEELVIDEKNSNQNYVSPKYYPILDILKWIVSLNPKMKDSTKFALNHRQRIRLYNK